MKQSPAEPGARFGACAASGPAPRRRGRLAAAGCPFPAPGVLLGFCAARAAAPGLAGLRGPPATPRYLALLFFWLPALPVIFRASAEGGHLACWRAGPPPAMAAGSAGRASSMAARRSRLPPATAQREAARLAAAGLTGERRAGRARLVFADPAGRRARPLTELPALAFGPHLVAGGESGSLEAIAVAIYGSWAARQEGIPGHAPHDTGVLVIGKAARRGLHEAAERAGQRLGLQVSPVLCSRSRWIAASDALIRQIRPPPPARVTGEEPRQEDG